jgi:hypothetical protein
VRLCLDRKDYIRCAQSIVSIVLHLAISTRAVVNWMSDWMYR